MNTLVISDLHIGTSNSSDLLRNENVRECLKQQLLTTERLVLLGDIVELRHGAPQQSVDLAGIVLKDLSEALPADAKIIFVPGNHDHALINQWLKEKTQQGKQESFELEQTIQPADASPFAQQLADAFSNQDVVVNYPGVWLHENCYATHGHYLDFHLHLPTIERLALSLMTRLLLEDNCVTSVRDYERCLEPVTAWIDTVSRWSDQRNSLVRGHSATLRKRLTETKKRSFSDVLLAGAFPAGVRVANCLGLGTFTSKLDGPTIRNDAIHAFTSVLENIFHSRFFCHFWPHTSCRPTTT